MLVLGLELGLGAALGHVLAVELAQHAESRVASGGHRADGDPGAGHRVAAREDLVQVGGPGQGIGGDGAPGGQLQARVLAQEGEVGALADGGDEKVGFQLDGVALVELGGEAVVVVKDPGALLEHQAGGLVALGVYGQHAPAVEHGDSLFQGLFHFPGAGRAFFLGLQHDHGHVGCAVAQGGAGRVDGHVAAAHHQHVVALWHRLAQAEVLQIAQGGHHVGAVLAVHVQLEAGRRAHAQEHRVKVVLQVREGHVPPDGGVELDLHAHLGDLLHLLGQSLPRQAVGGHAGGQGSARHGQGLVDHRLDPIAGQVVGAGQARRTGSHDGHLFAAGLHLGLGHILHAHLIGHQALDIADGDGLVHGHAAAGVLAGMGTDAPDGARQGQVLHDDGQALGELAHLGHLHIALYVQVGRAGYRTRGLVQLGYAVGIGEGLGVALESGLALTEALVKLIGQGDRTGLDAVAAGGAGVHVHVTGLLMHPHLEIARLAGNGGHLGLGEDLDVQVAPALHKFGRDDAHGAVVGGESLVQLGHASANGRGFLHQVDVVSRVGQVQRGLHAGYAGAYYHHRSDFLALCHSTSSLQAVSAGPAARRLCNTSPRAGGLSLCENCHYLPRNSNINQRSEL